MSVLRNLNYQVTCAYHGKEALALLKDKNAHFNLILMDCKMPVLDGYRTTQMIREGEKESGKHIPIIALTADISTKNKDDCIQIGMDDFLVKPLNRYAVEKTLSRYAKLYQHEFL